MSASVNPGGYAIRAMTLADHADVLRIWKGSEGICVVDDDSKAGIRMYLARNRGLCFVATVDSVIVGTVLCGHDGRRGILRHLAVKPRFRNRGIGRALTDRCLAALSRAGIRKCNLFVMDDNAAGMKFWRHLGFIPHKDEYRTLQAATPR